MSDLSGHHSDNHLGSSSRRDFVKGSLGLVLSSAALAASGAEAIAQTPKAAPVKNEGSALGTSTRRKIARREASSVQSFRFT